MRTEEKGWLVWRGTVKQGPINLDLIDIGITHDNMQIEIQFPWRKDDPGMLLWTL